MRHIVMVAIAVVFAVAIKLFKKHREKLLFGGIVILCLISGVYTYTRAESILPTRHPYNQTFYDPEYIKTQEFPDAFLRLYLKGKTVYVKNDVCSPEDAGLYSSDWEYAYYHVHNMVNYLNSVNANVVSDDNMNDIMVPIEKMSDFEDMGYLNDLLRNTLLYTKNDNEIGNYLFHTWYYRDQTLPVNIYINPNSLRETDEIVLLWQPKFPNEYEKGSEDMYMMGLEYFEKNIK